MARRVGERDGGDEVGQREGEVGGTLEDRHGRSAMTDGGDRDRERKRERDKRGGDADLDRGDGRGEQILEISAGARKSGMAALRRPVDEHAERDPVADRDHGSQRDEHRHSRPAELVARCDAPSTLTYARVVRVPAQARLTEEQDEAEPDRRKRQRGCTGRTEPQLVLGVDVEGERLELETDERVELDQRVQHDEEHRAEQRRTELRQDDTEERLPPAEPERPGSLLERRIEAPERHGDEQEDDRVVGERDDARRTHEALKRGTEVRPGVARHERRDRQGRHQQHRPQAPAGQPRSLDEPRRADAYRGADRRGRGRDLE